MIGTADLPKPRKSTNLTAMNAAQIIEEITRLPEEERGKVVEFFRKENFENVRYANDDVAQEAAEAVFEEHPGLFQKLAE